MHRLVKGSLTSYVYVEFVYDFIQGAIVSFFTGVNVGFMEEGKQPDNCYKLLSYSTSFVDFVLIKGPSAVLGILFESE
jgi:hypothetical protein